MSIMPKCLVIIVFVSSACQVYANTEELLESALKNHELSMQELSTGEGTFIVEIHKLMPGTDITDFVMMPKKEESTKKPKHPDTQRTKEAFNSMGINPINGYYRAEAHWWFKKDKYRCDRTPLPLESKQRAIRPDDRWGRFSFDGQVEWHVLNNTVLNDVSPGAKEPKYASIRKPRNLTFAQRLYSAFALDVRELMTPLGRSLREQVQGLLERGYKVSIEKQDGLITITCAHQEEGRKCEFVLDPKKGFHIVRSIAESKGGEYRWLDFKADYNNIDAVWFLKSTHCHRKSSGGKNVYEYKIEMKDVKLGQTIDNIIFGLAGMDVPVNFPVVDKRSVPYVSFTYNGALERGARRTNKRGSR